MILKFGKYKGKDTGEIAQDNEGLKYLHWLMENTDVNDAKYGKQNQILLAEIHKAVDGKTVDMARKSAKKMTYQKDNSQLPRDNGGASEILKSLDLVITILKRAYPDVYEEVMNQEAQAAADEEAPF